MIANVNPNGLLSVLPLVLCALALVTVLLLAASRLVRSQAARNPTVQGGAGRANLTQTLQQSACPRGGLHEMVARPIGDSGEYRPSCLKCGRRGKLGFILLDNR